MTAQVSAGILLYRIVDDEVEVLIGHPGGPFWAKKHEGAWSVPKGIPDQGEEPSVAADREFEEETGFAVPPGRRIDLGSVTQKSGKQVVAWAVEGNVDASEARSNTVSMEWPRGSGRTLVFPEIDEFRWCTIAEAEKLLNPAQVDFLPRLIKSLDHRK